MNELPLSLLFAILFGLLLCSAFFSGTETALMSLNRYRLRHRARSGVRSARIAEKLLSKPDRLIGLILVGNNIVNIVATLLVGYISGRIGGAALVLGPLLLIFVVLIFAEVTPKTLAALHPDRIAMPSVYVYYPLLKIMYPLVWLTNLVANGVLLLFGVRASEIDGQALSHEELRTVVNEAGALISRKYRTMLTGILDLEKVSVDDVMVPHNEIVGIDLDDDMDEILAVIETSQHTRLPVYEDNIDQIVGVLHMRRLVRHGTKADLDKDTVRAAVTEPYFVPEGTPLSVQLVQFQKRKSRLALVVDEYGDIQGMVTLEDILEEIVGEFTTDPGNDPEAIKPLDEHTYLVSGSVHVRDLNKQLSWDLPTDGAKTVNGLVQEQLETIPEAGTQLTVGNCHIEIVESNDSMVVEARMRTESEAH